MIPLAVFLRFSNIYSKGVTKQIKYHKIPKLSPELIIRRALYQSEGIFRFKMCGLVFQRKESLRLKNLMRTKEYSSWYGWGKLTRQVLQPFFIPE